MRRTPTTTAWMRILTSIPRELSFVVDVHPINRWLLVPLDFPGDIQVMMVLDTGSAISAISDQTCDKLAGAGLIGAPQAGVYMLPNPRIYDTPIADVRVRVSNRVSVVRAEGLLGLDFLQRFEQVHFHVPTLRLTLTYPTAAVATEG